MYPVKMHRAQWLVLNLAHKPLHVVTFARVCVDYVAPRCTPLVRRNATRSCLAGISAERSAQPLAHRALNCAGVGAVNRAITPASSHARRVTLLVLPSATTGDATKGAVGFAAVSRAIFGAGSYWNADASASDCAARIALRFATMSSMSTTARDFGITF